MVCHFEPADMRRSNPDMPIDGIRKHYEQKFRCRTSRPGSILYRPVNSPGHNTLAALFCVITIWVEGTEFYDLHLSPAARRAMGSTGLSSI